MKRPIESDYTSQVAYTRALEAYCDSLAQDDYRAVKTYHEGKPVYVSQPAQEPHPAVKSDMLVNGGALKLALNSLRRGTQSQQEIADELEKTAQLAQEPLTDKQRRNMVKKWLFDFAWDDLTERQIDDLEMLLIAGRNSAAHGITDPLASGGKLMKEHGK